jgi:DNA ligase-like, N-terminal NAD+-binding domain
MSETLDLFADLPEVKAEPALDLCARQIVVASYLYYRHDHSFMTDGEFDKMCQRVADRWSGLSPLRQLCAPKT